MSPYQEWLKKNPQPLDNTPEEQKDYRKKIVTACVGIDDCWVWARARTEAGYGTIRVGVSNRHPCPNRGVQGCVRGLRETV